MAIRKHDWFKRRRYCHFDSCLTAHEAERLVKSPNRVARHSFWPLVWYNDKQRIWRRSTRGHACSQPTAGPPVARQAQQLAIDDRVIRGMRTNRGRWKTKLRPIAYASHHDAAIFGYYAYLVQARYESWLTENTLSETVLAYRRVPRATGSGGKTNYDFAAEAFAEISCHKCCDVVCLDLKSFFDTLPHIQIKREWKRVCGFSEMPADHYAVFRAATRYSRVRLDDVRKALGISIRSYKRMRMKATPFRVDSESFDRLFRSQGLIDANTGPKRCGVPQGLPISGLLANLCMLGIDTRMQRLAAVSNGSYRRYSDDVLIIAPCGAGRRLAASMRKLVTDAGMSIQVTKTTFHIFRRDHLGRLVTQRPMQYLGFEFDGHQVTLRPQTLSRFSKRMRRAVRTAGRIAGRRWNGVGSVRIRRRQIYNLYSPLPYLWCSSDRKQHRGDFTDYARNAQRSVRDIATDRFLAQMLKQLRRRMKQLDKLIKEIELEQTLLHLGKHPGSN